MKYTIGVDIGIASIGWSVINWDELRIEDLGVRKFTRAENPKNGASLALPRRTARGARRRIRRKSYRMKRIKNLIVSIGIVTEKQLESLYIMDENKKDVWQLRTEGLDRLLSNEEWTRVLTHIAKRRGFKSNRKSESSDKASEAGKLLSGVNNNKLLLEKNKYRTIGEMFYKDKDNFGDHKRNKGGDYSHTVSRSMLLDEIKLLFNKQRDFGNKYADPNFEENYITIFSSQRPYATRADIEKMIGVCTFEDGEPRAVKMSYSAETFKLLTTVNNLRITKGGERIPLNKEQRESIIELAYKNNSVKYKQIRTILNLDEEIKFVGLNYHNKKNTNPEEQKFVELTGYHSLRKNITQKCGQIYWTELLLNTEKLDTIAYALTVYKDDKDIVEYLEANNIDKIIIDAVLELSFSKVTHLSIKAIKKLTPFLKDGLRYDEACEKVGYIFNEPNRNSNKLALLPCIPVEEVRNPVVLRALTQTRKVLNSIIKKYGSPEGINIEVARELSKPFDERIKIDNYQKENMTENNKIKERIEKEFGINDPKGEDILKFRLWKEQNGICPYSQEYLDPNRLFEHGYAQIDHIIPFSRCFDDSFSNKILVKGFENQNKGNKIPYEYLIGTGDRYNSFEAWVNTSNLSWKKKEKLLKKEFSKQEAMEFKERHLNDTKYIATYMSNFIKKNLKFASDDNKQKVVSVNGQVTAFLRAKWGLKKIREENDLHHALDAVVIAVTTQGMVQKISIYSKYKELYNIRKGHNYTDPETGEIVEGIYKEINLKHIPMPWLNFRDELIARLSENPLDKVEKFKNYKTKRSDEIKPIFVSRAPYRKITGAAHLETTYSKKHINENIAVVKKPLIDINLSKLDKMFDIENNKKLYEEIKARLIKYNNDPKKAFAEPLYKPTNSKKLGPMVRSIKISETIKSGVEINNGISSNASMIRVDVFNKNKKYYLVPIYVADVVGKHLPNKAITAGKNISNWNVVDDSYDFCFSLYSNDLIKIDLKNESIFGYYVGCDSNTGAISYDLQDGSNKKPLRKGVKEALNFEKYQVDILGNYYKVKKEERCELAKCCNK